MKYVYLAGPIMGCSIGEANDWRKYVDQAFREYRIVGISPLRCEPSIDGEYKIAYEDPKFGTARAIGSKNMFDTANCDLVLAYLPSPPPGKWPSLGTVGEIAWAHALRKPVIVVTNDPVLKQHPIINYCANWMLDTLDEAIEVCIGLLDGYEGGKNV